MDKIRDIHIKLNEWDLYNSFFLHDDIERLRKFLVREHFFKMVLELPGDIVEVGVFKGVGFAQLLKLREIFVPASNKKVIGFDLFFQSKEYEEKLNQNDEKLNEYYQNSQVKMDKGISKESIIYFIEKMKLTNTRLGFNTDIYQLIEGDVEKTIPVYLKENPGFRISYLYLDLDIDKPTYISLNLLYDRIVRGGIIVLDEYSCEKWTESNGVDRFLKEHPELEIKTLLWGRSPTAYIIKN
mgnify:CR=1 FL=1|tara:strand:+ start:111 stop:830 length:720 start_codon:yes stop_codon:yes gene_type:complete